MRFNRKHIQVVFCAFASLLVLNDCKMISDFLDPDVPDPHVDPVSIYFPQNKAELQHSITMLTQRGESLNKINTSAIKDMSGLFKSDWHSKGLNPDISAWDVSSATDMFGMFSHNTEFNQDISGWKVSKVATMERMFYGAKKFDRNLSSWTPAKGAKHSEMFKDSPMEGLSAKHPVFLAADKTQS